MLHIRPRFHRYQQSDRLKFSIVLLESAQAWARAFWYVKQIFIHCCSVVWKLCNATSSQCCVYNVCHAAGWQLLCNALVSISLFNCIFLCDIKAVESISRCIGNELYESLHHLLRLEMRFCCDWKEMLGCSLWSLLSIFFFPSKEWAHVDGVRRVVPTPLSTWGAMLLDGCPRKILKDPTMTSVTAWSVWLNTTKQGRNCQACMR